MKAADRQTRRYLMELFEKHGFHPRTAFGQNFLIDLNLVDVLVREAELGSQDVVLEIAQRIEALDWRDVIRFY